VQSHSYIKVFIFIELITIAVSVSSLFITEFLIIVY